jgi:NTP pyrophosphatase (non-canonical NTP hydrolase)
MNSSDYIKNAIKTEVSDYDPVVKRLSDAKMARILHGIIGISTESGELLDAIKKHLMYGKPLDEVNIKEEVADCFWYMAILADTLGFSFEEIQERNIAKLKARFGDKFTEESAINRDLEKERKILEE